MTETLWAGRLRGWIAWNLEEVETSVRRVAPAAFRVRPSSRAPSVAFHAWHIGRWVDRHTACLSSFLDPEALRGVLGEQGTATQ